MDDKLGTFYVLDREEVCRVINVVDINNSFKQAKLYHCCIYRLASSTVIGECADAQELFQSGQCCEVPEDSLRKRVTVGGSKFARTDYFCKFRIEHNALTGAIDFSAELSCTGGKRQGAFGRPQVVAFTKDCPVLLYRSVQLSINTCVAICPNDEQELFPIYLIRNIFLPHEKAKVGCAISATKVQLALQAFYRPVDESPENLLYLTATTATLPMSRVSSVVQVFFSASRDDMLETPSVSYGGFPTFSCAGIFDVCTGSVRALQSLWLYQPNCATAHGPQRRLRCLDLYSGCGGLSAGLEMSGLTKSCWAVDANEKACGTFKRNFPDCKVSCRMVSDWLSDVRAMKDSSLPQPGEVEIIVGGPPCQGFSGFNRRKSTAKAVENNSQTVAYMEVVEYFAPRFFVMENVKAIVTHDNGRHLQTIIARAVALGYKVRYSVLQASDYGVPQHRERVFIIGASDSGELPGVPVRTHHSGKPLQTLRCGKTELEFGEVGPAFFKKLSVRDAIGDLSGARVGTSGPEVYPPAVTAFQSQMRRGAHLLEMHFPAFEMSPIDRFRVSKIRPGEDWRALLALDESGRTLKSGKQVRGVVPRSLSKTAMRNGNWKGAYGRLRWTETFKTIIAKQNLASKSGTVIHPAADRTLTLRETARAQSFPDRFRFEGSSTDILRQVRFSLISTHRTLANIKFNRSGTPSLPYSVRLWEDLS